MNKLFGRPTKRKDVAKALSLMVCDFVAAIAVCQRMEWRTSRGRFCGGPVIEMCLQQYYGRKFPHQDDNKARAVDLHDISMTEYRSAKW